MRVKDLVPFLGEYFTKDTYDIPLLLVGGIGIGKSECVKTAAKNLGVGFIDLRFSSIDNIDLRGIPTVKDGWTKHNPADIIPLVGTDHPEKGILFLDEITLGDRLTRAAGYQLVLERCMGDRKVKAGWLIVAATNRAEDRSDIDDLPAALKNRFLPIYVTSTIEDYATYIGDESEVTVRYLKENPSELFGSVENDVFATPRSWKRVSRLIKAFNGDTDKLRELVEGLVGKTAGHFLEFVSLGESKERKLYNDIVAGRRIAGIKTEDIEPIVKILSEAEVAGCMADVEACFRYFGRALKDNKEKIVKLLTVFESTGFQDRLTKRDLKTELSEDARAALKGLISGIIEQKGEKE